MNCAECKELLVVHLEGLLEGPEKQAVLEHLGQCQTCRAELEELQTLQQRLVNNGKALAQSDLENDVMNRIIREQNARLKATDQVSAGLRIRRLIMRSSITKLSIAAAVVIALLIIMEHLGGSTKGTGIAWGDVRTAFLAQRWVHVKYDNGDEQWSNLQTGDSYFKQWNGRYVAVDHARNIRRVYHPTFGQHISEDRPVIYKDDVIPPWEPKTAWESVIGSWETMAEHGGTRDWEVERHPDQTGGTQLIRFDCYYNDVAGRRLLIKQIWADPKTRLPLTIWERLQLAERKDQKRESKTGAFDFPQTGPASIYDLAVPRDLPIVKNYDKVPAPPVEKLFDTAKTALARFPARYRVVVWDNTRESEVDVTWRDGGKIRMDRYFNLPPDMHPQHHLALPAQAQDILKWTQTQPPISTYMSDGERTYTRHYVHPVYPDSRNEARVLRLQGRDGLPLSSKPIEEQWPYAKNDPAGFEMIRDAPEELSRYIGLRTGGADRHQDFYLDPEHDSICVRWIWWKQRSGRWEKEREYEYSGFTRLPEGQWYATKRILVTYPDPERGTVRGGANWNIDVQVLEEGDFPPDTFDGEKLLEGAKIETY